MKKIVLKQHIILLVSFCLLTFNATAQFNNDSISQRFKAFYTYYIIENDKPLPNNGVSKDTLKKYFTSSFLKKMHNDKELDYDPIVHAQDYDKEFVKTLKVAKLADSNPKKYCVSYWYEFAKKTDSLIIYVANEAGNWKIAKTCHGKYCY